MSNEDYDQAMLNVAGKLYEAASLQYGTAAQESYQKDRPSTRLLPRLSIDGDHWCALFGTNLQDGVAGFGLSPELAYADFDKSWHQLLQKMQQVNIT